MTVKDLKEFIKDLPDDMLVLTWRFSDYREMDKEDVSIVKAVKKNNGEWYMGLTDYYYGTASEEDKRNMKECLFFTDN